jgi:lipopolysaccharide biosynthesis glycosyltransferase
MPKNALFCINIYKDPSQIPPETGLAIKSFEKYCEKFNLELIVIDKPKYNFSGKANYQYLILEKFQAYDYLETKYDRLLKVDTDMLITAFCPNMFEVVPEDSLGVVYEDIGSRKVRRRKEIIEAKKAFGNLGWNKDYFNAGMMVMSRQHNAANYLDEGVINNIHAYPLDHGVREQNILNWKVRKFGYKIHELDYRYNHMFMFDEINLTNLKLGSLFKDKTKHSFIIHYAGDKEKRVKLMTADFPKIMSDWNNSL